MNLKNHMHITNGAFLGHLPLAQRTLFCRRCCFSRWVSAANPQTGLQKVFTGLMTASWRVNLMLLFSRSLLTTEYSLPKVLKVLVSTISMRNLHIMFLSKITPTYFTPFTKGMLRPFHARRDSGCLIRLEG
jgi:hypothetical protein